MLKPRTPFLISLLASVIGMIVVKVAAATVKAIFDVTVQDFWKDTIAPYLSAKVGPWSTLVLEAIGPYWMGFGSAFLIMFAVEMVLAGKRKAAATVPIASDREPNESKGETWVRFERDRYTPFKWKMVDSNNIFQSFQIYNPVPSITIKGVLSEPSSDAERELKERYEHQYPFPAQSRACAEYIDTFFMIFDIPFSYDDTFINTFGKNFPAHDFYGTTKRGAILYLREVIGRDIDMFEIRFVSKSAH